MDLGDSAEYWPDDVNLGVEEFFDDSVLENEPCGICLDVVIDRGVLDSCDHWFCFACIDNWATITNLCPTCKKEFQLITCLPVYDSFGNTKVDEHSLSRDEDWYIQGKSNTLSFPSYYINEDAVICLDGDGCRIRNKLPTEDELNLDTSIACDSCDVWYHAFCVGFDPEDTSHSSWLCPRCEKDALPQGLEYTSEEDLSSDHEQSNHCSFQSVGSVLSGKISVSVADAGETAVVVSLFDGNQFNEEGHHEEEACASMFDQDDDQFLVINAAGNQSRSEFSSEGSPEKAVIHSNADEPGTKFLFPVPREEDDEKFTILPPKDQIDQSLESHTVDSPAVASPPKDTDLHQTLIKEGATSDIMSIVQSSKAEEKRLRVKKIMWRSSHIDGSSSLIQTLRNEIRDTVCDKNISDISKAFDGKLLSAFRAAISRPENMTVNNVDTSSLRTRNILLQKGKVRENLTKKVYATASGRRKRAWDRDLTVEFWKRRCLSSEPEKVKTLQSVLDLLKKVKSPNVHLETEQAIESETDNSLLSRLYLADMSVLPRTENIKPLSVLADEKPKSSAEGSGQNKRLKIDGNAPGVKIAKKGNELSKEPVSSSSSSKTDKRQWALEVLARKSSSSNSGPPQSREEDHFLKGNYPLLAQLPLERRPVPDPCSHTKIPIPVRQAQLYRLAEYFLKRADVAEVELAVADAVNVEKELCERSKSKLVYVNLCSQRMAHGRTSNVENVNLTEIPVERVPKEVKADSASRDGIVEETLRLAGLLSDSPPNSPLPEDNPSVVAGDDLASDSRPLSIIKDEACDLEKSEPEIRPSTEMERHVPEENQEVNNLCKSRVPDPDSSVSHVNLHDDDRLKNRVSALIPELEGKNDEESSLHDSEINLPATGSWTPVENTAVQESTEKGSSSNHSVLNETVASNELGRSVISKMSPVENNVVLESTERGSSSNHSVPNEADAAKELGRSAISTMAPVENTVVQESTERGSSSHHSVPNEAVAAEELGRSAISTMAPVENTVVQESTERGSSSHHSVPNVAVAAEELGRSAISKMVQVYIKEHIRPLCKSGVITVDQYRWAVGKATEKVMRYHSKAKNASFLIKEGDKVKKLAEGYVAASQSKDWKPLPSQGV